MRPALSIVVASVESGRRIDAALASLAAAAAPLAGELLVMDASRDDSAIRAARRAGVVVQRFPVGTLVPDLWAAGIRAARGEVVAITTAHTVVPPDWARILVDALASPAVGGVGGPMTLAASASRVDAAVFFLRYAAFLETQVADGPVSGEIAGDNAAYRRADLLADPETLRHGFWELPFHQQLRRRGLRLEIRHAAWAEFGHAFPLATIAAHRFRHGREYGATRVTTGGRSRLATLALAPLVPPLLVWRALRRVQADPAHRGRLPGALPALVALAAAWATGEALGALAGDAPRPGEAAA